MGFLAHSSIEKSPGNRQEILLSRFWEETVESFMSNLIKRPFKLFMLCMVLYVASQSIIVGVFVAVLGMHFLYRQVLGQKQEAINANQAAKSDPSVKSKLEPKVEAGFDMAYERSAVVTPIRRTGTQNRS